MAGSQLDPSFFNYRTICELSPTQLAVGLRARLAKYTETSISTFLFQGLESDGIHPVVVATWLSVSKSLSTVLLFLTATSRIARRAALRTFASLLRLPTFRTTWDQFGGVEAVLKLLEQSSVEDVAVLTSTLRHRLTSTTATADRRNAFDQLFRALMPAYFHTPSSQPQTRDKRALARHYLQLLPLCSTDFILTFYDEVEARKNPLRIDIDPAVILQHPKAFQDILLAECRKDTRPRYVEIGWPAKSMLTKSSQSTPSPARRNWSAPMLFTSSYLDAVGLRGAAAAKGGFNTTASEVLHSLLQRAIRRRIPSADVAAIMEKALQLHYRLAAEDESLHSSTIKRTFHLFLKAWVRGTNAGHKELFDDLLLRLLRLASERKLLPLWRVPCPELPQYLRRCQARLRRPLLRLFALSSRASIDIDALSASSLKRFAGSEWPCDVFLALPTTEARELLDQLLGAGSENFVVSKSPLSELIFSWPPYYGGPQLDVDLLRTYLLRGTEEGRLLAAEIIEKHRKNSPRLKEPEHRGFYARSCFLFSIASRDLQSYKSTLIWSKRYIKDHFVARQLFVTRSVRSEEWTSVMSAIPRDAKTFDASETRKRVEEANEILTIFWELADAVEREPWSKPGEPCVYTAALGDVVSRRLDIVEELQGKHALSDEVVYDSIWAPTLQTLIDVERTFDRPTRDQNGSRRGGSYGPFGHGGCARSVKSPASLRFLDRLAEARNDLWQETRIAQNPDVLSLPPPWVKGLPVQALLNGVDQNPNICQRKTPFLLARAAGIVFMSEEAAAQAELSVETKRAIGSFIDSYACALSIFVLGGEDDDDRRARVKKAWDHALSALSWRFQRAEAIRFWVPKFDSMLQKLESPPLRINLGMRNTRQTHHITIPTQAEADVPNEWNPAAGVPGAAEAKVIAPTALDHFLTGVPTPRFDQPFPEDEPKAIIPPLSSPGFSWDAPRYQTVLVGLSDTDSDSSREGESRQHAEGVVASSLMFANSLSASKTQLLPSAFPGKRSQMRFPPLFFESDFLETLQPATSSRQGGSITDAFDALHTHLDRIPLSLMVTITERLFEATGKDALKLPDTDLGDLLYRALRLLTLSDKPHLATRLVQGLVFERPDSSSWARQVFTPELLKRLPSEEARRFITNCAKQISRLQSQQAARSPPGGSEAWAVASNRGPAIKITTVKMFALLIGDLELTSFELASEILGELLIECTHIDARVVILSALVDQVQRAAKEGNQDERIRGLQQKLLTLRPALGSLNERSPGAEHVGKRGADDEMDLISRDRQLFDAVTQASGEARLPKSFRDFLITELLLPALADGIQTHRNYLKMVASAYKLEIDIDSVPVLPLQSSSVSSSRDKFWDIMSSELMQVHHDHLLLLVKLPAEVQKANEAIRSNWKFRDSRAGKHWTSYFGEQYARHASHKAMVNKWYRCISGNTTASPALESGLLTMEKMEGFFVEQAHAILSEEAPNLRSWEALTGPDGVGGVGRNTEQAGKLTDQLKLFDRRQQLITVLLRDLEEQRARNGRGGSYRRLPTTLPLRMQLLRPTRIRQGTSKEQTKSFAEDLLSILDEELERCVDWRESFEQICNAKDLVPQAEQRLEVALVLGDLGRGPTPRPKALYTVLKVQLASSFFLGVPKWDRIKDSACREAADCVDAWTKSDLEQVRERGFDIKQRVKMLSDAQSYRDRSWG